MLSLLMDGLLYFSHLSVVLIIIMLGWLFYDKQIFFYAACLGCLSLIINVALKGTFKVPLSPELHLGYAFPSGHMQFSTVFYGWLFYYFNNRVVRSAIIVLLVCLGIGMIKHHYHNLTEILAGFVTGVMMIQLFILVLKRYNKKIFIPLLIFACLVMSYNFVIYSTIPTHAKYAFATLVILISANYLFSCCALFFQQNWENGISRGKEKHQEI